MTSSKEVSLGYRQVPYHKSIAHLYPEMLGEYDYSVNPPPETIAPGSNYKARWRCSKCTYLYSTRITEYIKRGSRCGGCAGRVVTSFNNLAYLLPILAKEWATSNPLQPFEVTCGSNIIVTWQCSKCSSHYKMKVAARTGKGYGCPICRGYRINSYNSLESKHPELSKEWHEDNLLNANQVGAGSGNAGKWRCSQCSHVYNMRIKNRTFHGQNCPVCNRIGWTEDKTKKLLNHLGAGKLLSLESPQLRTLLVPYGILNSKGKGRVIVEELLKGTFSQNMESKDLFLAYLKEDNLKQIMKIFEKEEYSNRKYRSSYIKARDRATIFDRDDYCCQICNSSNDLTIDHFWPVKLGGHDGVDNYWTMCKKCNAIKSGIFPNMFYLGKWLDSTSGKLPPPLPAGAIFLGENNPTFNTMCRQYKRVELILTSSGAV